MTVDIRLLGVPDATDDGRRLGVRGHKPWLVLALLLLTDRPPSRERLQRLLFTDADDPAAALRWNLSQLRRLGLILEGDPLRLAVPAGVRIDVDVLLRDRATHAVSLGGLDEDLLGGVRVEPSSDLEVWLEEERRRVRRLCLDVRHEAALALLGSGNTDQALACARETTEADPLDENAAALYVRCLRASGRLQEAKSAARDAARRLRSELGVEPSPSLWAAAAAPVSGEPRVSGRSAVVAQVSAGEAAVAAGAVDVGVALLQAAVVAARALDDASLLARTLASLGSALVHGVRGVDEEGLALLHEAVALTDGTGEAAIGVAARREIGYVDFLRGRYDRARRCFNEARTQAPPGTSDLGWIDVYSGACATDVGSTADAERLLGAAEDSAHAEGDMQLAAFAGTMLGRHWLLRDQPGAARDRLMAALALVTKNDWLSFRPFPEALLAETLRREGDLVEAREIAEHAYALAAQVGDPCWESAALRTLGLINVDEGALDAGLALLEQAPLQCRRFPDTYLWIELWGYAALVDVGRAHGLGETSSWERVLHREATARGMRSLVGEDVPRPTAGALGRLSRSRPRARPVG